MFYSDTLQSIIDQNKVSQALHKGSTARWPVRCLQIALNDLGYGEEMNWAKYMADGGYGGGSTRAVAAFLQKNGLSGNGETVEKEVLERMLVMVAAKDDLATLRQAIADGTVSDNYSQDGGTEVFIKGLQRMLYLLGYGEQLAWDSMSPSGVYHNPTIAAVKAFGLAESIPTDGASLHMGLARKMKEKVTALYGAKLDLGGGASAGRRGADITVSEIGGKLYAWDQFFKISLPRHKLGVSLAGKEKANAFVDLYRDALLAAGLTESAFRVMVPVSENEGAMDAINTWDLAFLSFGMYQWTMGMNTDNGELPTLLHRIKKMFPDTFEEYYGRYGLDIDVANSNEVYGRVTLNGKSIHLPADKEAFRDHKWAFRFWRSGLDPRIKLAQILHGFDRLYSFYDHKNYLVKVGGNSYRVREVITSEYGVALILDHHVNRPAHPRKHIASAIEKLGLASKDPATWTTKDEQDVIAKYLEIRASSSMTDPVKRANTTKEYLTVTDQKLSDERGSFEWKPSTKSVDGGVFPRGLDESAYPIIRETEDEEESAVPTTSSEEPTVSTPPPAEKEGWLKRVWKSIFG